jgi:thiol-disulfide isomerase/thioredoxin
MLQQLQEFDFYKKVHKDLYQSTTSGGLLSTCSAIFVSLLFVLEFQAYLTVTHMSQIVMDSGKYEPYVSVRFNVTFPHLPCKYLSAELQDVYGEHTLNESTSSSVDVRIFKWRVVDEGKRRVSVMEEHKEPTETGHHEILPADHHVHFMEKKVTNLTVATFDQFIRKYDVVVVDFYAPWCIWCQRLEPVFENTANEVASKDYSEFVRFARVDCTTKEWAPICRKKKIFAYPSVFLYRDGRSDRHQQYHGERSTSAFIRYIEGLPVETEQAEQLLDEEEQVREELEQEAMVKKGTAERHEGTANNLPIMHGINHPLKKIGKAGNYKEHGLKALMSILNILANNGGARQGGSIRILRSSNGGTVRVISLRRIPFGKRHGAGQKGAGSNLPASIPLKAILKGEGADAKKKDDNGNGGVKIKILENPAKNPVKEIKEKQEGVKLEKAVAAKVAVEKSDPHIAEAVIKKEVNPKPANPAPAAPPAGTDGSKKRRRLLGVSDTPRHLTTSELSELVDEFMEANTETRQQLWKSKVLTLGDKQQALFQKMLDKAKAEDRDDDEDDHHDDEDDDDDDDEGEGEDAQRRRKRRRASPEDLEGRKAKDHPLYSGHTEGCLVYGAIAAEKVPGTLRFTAKSLWHDFVAQHIDMSHTFHHLSFGDLTHVLQNEFEHVDFHNYEGLKYISSLGGQTFRSKREKATHHHYTKVVKTKFRLLDSLPKQLRGHELFQYTASSHQYEDHTHVPSVKVSYDFSPMTLYFKEVVSPLYKFLTSVCAIIGGAVTVFGMINGVVHHVGSGRS